MHDIIIAVISCGVINVIATAIISSAQSRKSRLKAVENKIDLLDKRISDVDKNLIKAEKDSLRTQLLLLISDYPDNKEGILAVGERYFGVLRGDWYATALFNTWLTEKDIAKPSWFNGGGKSETE